MRTGCVPLIHGWKKYIARTTGEVIKVHHAIVYYARSRQSAVIYLFYQGFNLRWSVEKVFLLWYRYQVWSYLPFDR